MVAIGPAGEPFGGEHRVLRGLDDGGSFRAVAEADDALDAQEIVAAVHRQSTQSAGEFEAADRAFEDDRQGGDAVRVRLPPAPTLPRLRRGPPPPRACTGRVFQRASDSLPCRRGRVGVGACGVGRVGAARAGEHDRRRLRRGGAEDAFGGGVEGVETRCEGGAQRGEVGLRDDQGVGDRDLPRRLGEALERRRAGERVDQRHHPAEHEALVEHRVGAQGEEHRGGIGEPAGFDDDAAKPADLARIASLDEAAQGLRQILAHRAAQAPARQFQHLAFDEIDEVMVDRDLADLVDDDGGIGKGRIGQDAAQQRRFAAAEKAGQHRDRYVAWRGRAIHRTIHSSYRARWFHDAPPAGKGAGPAARDCFVAPLLAMTPLPLSLRATRSSLVRERLRHAIGCILVFASASCLP